MSVEESLQISELEVHAMLENKTTCTAVRSTKLPVWVNHPPFFSA
jgi:hypothetical protein